MTTLTDIAAELAEVKSELRAVNARLASMPPPPEWITLQQLADREGKTLATIQRHAREGKLNVKGKAKARMVYAPKPRKDEV